MKTICPNCQNTKKFYELKDGRLKCSVCKKYFTAQKKTLHINKSILEEVIILLLKNKSTNEILKKISISKFQLLKIKKIIRSEISRKLSKELKLKDQQYFPKTMNTFEKCCCILNNQNKRFIDFLEKSLSGKGGIRSEKIHNILIEYFWRFENQKKDIKKQADDIFKLIQSKIWFKD